MGEIVDAIKAVAELGKDSVRVARPELESIEQRLKKLEDDKKKRNVQQLEVWISAGKFLILVVGATLVMWLAGDHVVGLLHPKADTLAQRIGRFSVEHDRKSAVQYLSDCITQLQTLQKSVALGERSPSPATQKKEGKSGKKPEEPKVAASSSSASGGEAEKKPAAPASSSLAREPLKISREQVTTLRGACSKIVGE
jgi:hypothetical protein